MRSRSLNRVEIIRSKPVDCGVITHGIFNALANSDSRRASVLGDGRSPRMGISRGSAFMPAARTTHTPRCSPWVRHTRVQAPSRSPGLPRVQPSAMASVTNAVPAVASPTSLRRCDGSSLSVLRSTPNFSVIAAVTQICPGSLCHDEV